MKRNLIAASVCLTVLLALGGCSNTGDVDTTNSSAPGTYPSASTGVGNNDGGIPNNAGGTANNGGTSAGTGAGTVGGGTNSGTGTGTDALPSPSLSVIPDSGANNDGDYSADDNGQVNGDDDAINPRGLVRDAEDAVRDVTRGAERAVRDVL